MAFSTILGLVAAALTTTSYMPQVIKAWTTRSAKDLSFKMLVALWLGLALWVVYGVVVSDVVVVIANGASFVLVSFLLVFKLRWKPDQQMPAE